MAVDAATTDQLAKAHLLHGLIQSGLATATLQAPSGLGSDEVFAVIGRLMSGLRTTLSVGSGWNSVLASLAFGLLGRLVSTNVLGSLTLEIGGDDTKLVTLSYLDALCIKILYDALGAIANETKFSPYKRRVEFLCIETSDHARGYPARSVPGLVQRQPSNACPWWDEGTLCGLVKMCATLRRRSPCPDAVDQISDHLQQRWFSRLKLDPNLGSIPLSCGGLGLSAWAGTSAIRSWATAPPLPCGGHGQNRLPKRVDPAILRQARAPGF